MAPAKRELTFLLADSERRLLRAVAARLAAGVTPDLLTMLGVLGALGVGAAYALSRFSAGWLWAASGCLVVQWLGDSLDGTLARVRDKQRPRYGFYVDHIVDCLGALFLLGGLALSSFMSHGIALGLLIVYLLLSCEVYLATYTLGKFAISFWKFSPTELRILLAAGNVALFLNPRAGMTLPGGRYSMFDIGGAIGIVGMALVLAVSVVKHTRTLYQSEPAP